MRRTSSRTTAFGILWLPHQNFNSPDDHPEAEGVSIAPAPIQKAGTNALDVQHTCTTSNRMSVPFPPVSHDERAGVPGDRCAMRACHSTADRG